MLSPLKDLLKQRLRRTVPDSLLSQMAFELRESFKSAVKSRATAKRYREMDGIRVNVGCGGRPTSGWVNLDMLADPRIDYWDCRKELPFRDGAVAAIYTEHFLEHLEYGDEARKFLQNCRRCLSDTGVLRIVVPDAAPYLKLYTNDDWEGLTKLRPLTKDGNYYRDYWLGNLYSTKMELINALFRQNGEHKYAYDAETLIQLLRSVGFSRVTQMSFGDSLDPAMPPDTPERQSESLYVEATKT
jgi:predicted SAM-dependent methyltransferase